MAISEQSRHDLHRRLEEILGPGEAATLMEHLPPRGWADVATKADLDHHSAITKRDLDAQGVAIRGEIERLAVSNAGEFAAVRSEMSSMSMRIETLRSDLEVRIEISQRQTSETLYRELAATTRTVVFACLGAIMTSSGLAFAAARF